MQELRIRLALVGLLATCCLGPEAPALEQGMPPFLYSKVFVPQNRLDDFEGDFVPLLKDRFEELVQAVEQPTVRQFEAGRLERAVYDATFQDNGLVRGNARLTIVGDPDRTTTVPLPGCGLPILRPRWTKTEAAVVGLSASGEIVVVVPANEEQRNLRFNWSLAGKPTWSAIQFSMRLPDCPRNTIRLVLPDGLELTSNHGLVSKKRDPLATKRTWVVEAGSVSHIELSVSKARVERQAPLTIYKENADYTLTPHGIDGVIEYSLDVIAAALPHLAFDAQGAVRIKSILLNGAPIQWSHTKLGRGQASNSASQQSRTLIELPNAGPLQRGRHQARLEFSSPVLTAPVASVNAQPLPVVRPRGLVWQSGRATASVMHPLYIADLNVNEARQTGQRQIAAPGRGQLLEWDFLQRDGEIRLAVAPQLKLINGLLGTTITIGGPHATAEIVAELSAPAGDTYQIDAKLLPAWSVESLEFSPNGMLSDWSAIRGADGRHQLELRFTRPLRHDEPARIVVTAKGRRVELGSQVDVESLQVIDFSNVAIQDSYFAVRTLGATQLRVQGDDSVVPLDALALTEKQNELLRAKRGDYIFRRTAAANELRVSLQRGQPLFDADVQCTATIGKQSVTEQYEIGCHPEGAPLDQILVQITPMRNEPITWTLASGTELSARRLGEQERAAANIASTSEAWWVLLPDTTASTILVQGQRSVVNSLELTGEVELSAVRTPNARTGRSKVNVVAAEDAAANMYVDTELTRLPLPFSEANQVTSLVGSYLVPGLGSEATRIVVTRAKDSLQEKAWIWQGNTDTRFNGTGTLVHESRWIIENHGRKEVAFQVGQRDLRVLTLDGRVVPTPVVDDAGWIRLALPANQRFVHVVMEYSELTSPITLFKRIRFQSPATNLPELNHDWAVALPSRYAAWSDPSNRRPHWAQRLFGLMARTIQSPGLQRTSVEEASPSLLSRLVRWGGLDERRGTLMVYDVPALRLIGWLVFLTLVLIRPRLQTRVYLLSIGAGAMLLILCPAPAVSLFRGVLWGLVVAWVARHMPRVPHAELAAGSLGRFAGASTVLVVATVFFLAGDKGEPAVAESRETTSPTFHVLFPVDSKDKPVGKYVHLPEAMYDLLLTAAEDRKPAMEKWILGEALYQARLTPTDLAAPIGSATALDVNVVEATLVITTFRPGMTVDIPMVANQITGILVLDGVEISPRFAREGQALRIVVPEPGDHRLRLSYSPRRGRFGLDNGFDLSVPKIPNTRLELSIPVGEIQPRIPSSVGVVSFLGEKRLVVADLGPAGLISSRWESSKAVQNENQLEIDQLSWVHIEPGVAIRYVQFFSGDPDQQLGRVGFDIDARTIPLPIDASEGTVEVVNRGDDRRSVTLTRAAGNSQPGLLVPLLLSDVRGLGEFQIPPIQLSRAKLRRDWLALTVADPMIIERGVHPDFEVVPAREFSTRWGRQRPQPAGELPQYVVAQVNAEADWNVKTLPRLEQMIAESELAIDFRPGLAQLAYESNIAPFEGNHFQHRLRGPPGMSVSDVTVINQGTTSPSRWVQSPNGDISVFTNDDVAGPYTLRLMGSVTLANMPVQQLPMITIDGVTETSLKVRIFRSPDMNVELLDHPHLQRLATDDLGLRRTLGRRPVATLEGTGTGTPAVKLRVTANRPRILGHQLTTLRYTDSSWNADVRYRISFRDGTPDVLRFSIPDTWGESLETTPKTTWSIESLPDGRRRLLVLPQIAPTATTFDLAISGVLQTSDVISVPDVVPLGSLEVQRWVALPETVLGNKIDWVVQQMEPALLPPEMQSAAPLTARATGFQTYQATGKSPTAEFRRSDTPSTKPFVLLKDVQFRLAKRSAYGVASFDIDAAGSSSAVIRIPPESNFVAALVEDSLATIVNRLGHHELEIELGPHYLPQHLQVIFQCPTEVAKERSPLIRAPQLVDVKVRRTIWSVHSDHAGTRFQASPKSEEVSRDEQSLSRLYGGLRAMRRQPETTEEIGDWFYRWQRRILQRLAFHGDETTDTARFRRRQVQSELSEIARKLRVPEQTTSAVKIAVQRRGNVPTLDKLIAVDQRGAAPSSTIQFFATPLKSEEFQLSRPALQFDQLRAQVVPCLILACLMVLAWILLSAECYSGVLRRWPHVLVALIGIAWAMWLVVPWLGAVITGIAAWLALGRGVSASLSPLATSGQTTEVREAIS